MTVLRTGRGRASPVRRAEAVEIIRCVNSMQVSAQRFSRTSEILPSGDGLFDGKRVVCLLEVGG
jgi:hypothetical protein